MEMIDLCQGVDQGHYLLDHCFVDMIIKAGIDPPPAKQITYTKLKIISLSNFNIDVLHEFNQFGTMPLDQQVDHYSNTLKEILDRHAPEQTKTLRVSLEVSWYSLEQYIGCISRQAFNYYCSLLQVWGILKCKCFIWG